MSRNRMLRRRGGVYTPPSQILLSQLLFDNTSGSTQATNWISLPFGRFYKKGDIPSGTWPDFQTTGGTSIPYGYRDKTTWSDGSLKFLGIMALGPVPSSVAGSTTFTVNEKNGGSAPTAGSRSLSNISAQDFKMLLTGITNLTSGPWTSSVNQGITDNDDVKQVGGGGKHSCWRIRQQFMSGGAGTEHGQLECYWYVDVLEDASNALGCFRLNPRAVQPWLDIDSPAKNKRGFTASLQNGASTAGITQPSTGSAKAYSMTNGNPAVTCTGHGYDTGIAIQLSTPPSPFATGTDYYTRVINANSFEIYPTAGDSVAGTNRITPTANGSGTATPHIELVHFASFFGANADGSPQFLQGTGSVAAETTMRLRIDTTYARSTKLVPPYDTAVSPVNFSTISYAPNGKGTLEFYFHATGEDPQIGVQPGWVATHFLTQAAVDERHVYVNALSMGAIALGLKRNSTLTVPVVSASSGTPYTGMGTASSTLRWNTNVGATSGFTNPSGDLIGCIQADDTSHWPSALYYAYLISGRPEFADLLMEIANYVVIQRSADESRNPTTGGTFFGACFQDPSQARTDAWAAREVALAAGILPDSHWENANIKTYMTDLMKASFDSINAYNAAQSSFWTTNGVYHFRGDDATGAPWQHGFMIAATAMAYAVTEYAGALTFLNHLVKFPAAIDTDIGLLHYTCFTTRMRQTDSGAGALVSAMSQIHYSPGGGFSGSWVNVGDTITLLVGSSQFTLSNDDKILGMLGAAGVPAGLTAMTSYFAINVSDPGITSNKTLKASLTSGGSAVNITADGSGEFLCLRTVTIPSGSTGLDYGTLTSYPAMHKATLRFAEAVGATSVNGVRVKMDAIVANSSLNYANDPKNAMVASF